MTVEDDVFARADVLMQSAPGVVSVRRISHIDDVSVLRAARAELTGDEVTRLRQLRLELMERLDGAVTAKPPAQFEREKGLRGALSSLLRGAANAMSADMRNQGGLAPKGPAGAPARLPAPTELLDAAEAWVISHWVHDRLDADVTVLRRSWEQAAIDPVG